MLLYAFLLNTVAYLAPNAYALAHPCALFAPFVTWCRLVRWICLNVLFASVALLALQSWWTARFPHDDVAPEEYAVVKKQQRSSRSGSSGSISGWSERLAGAAPLAVRAAPLALVFLGSIGVVIALAVVADGDVRTQGLRGAPCRDAFFTQDCQRAGLHLTRAHRWLLYAHAILIGASCACIGLIPRSN